MFFTTRFKESFHSHKFFRILMFALTLVALIVSSPSVPQSASASSQILVCNRGFNRHDPEKGEWYASTAERYPNEKGEHCSYVQVAIWDGPYRKAYGVGYNGFVQRFWYGDPPYWMDMRSWHWAQTNVTKVSYQFDLWYY